MTPLRSTGAGHPMESADPGRLGLGPRLGPYAAETVLAACFLLPGFLFPVTLDQGVFGLAAQAILDGDLPYRDVFDQKGPALYYTLATAMAFLGEHQWVVRLFFTTFTLLGALCAAELGGRLGGRTARIPCLIFYCTLSLIGDGDAASNLGQPEDITVALSLLAVLLVSDRGRARTVAAGALLGLMPWYKPTAAIPAAAIGLAWWFSGATPADAPERMARVGPLVTGFAVPTVVFVGLLVLRDNWAQFWESVVVFNLSYATADVDRSGLLIRLWHRMGIPALLAIPGLRAISRDPRPEARLLVVSIGAALVVMVLEGKFFTYHMTPVVLLLAIPAGISVSLLAARRLSRTLAGRVVVTLGVLLLGVLITPKPVATALTYARAAGVVSGALSLSDFRGPYPVSSVYAAQMEEFVTYIRARTAPDDRVLILGHEGVASFWLNRRSPTRYHGLPALFRDDSPASLRRRAEMVAEVLARPPAYIALAPKTQCFCEHITPIEAIERLPELRRLLNEQYEAEGEVGSFVLYRRVAGPAP